MDELTKHQLVERQPASLPEDAVVLPFSPAEGPASAEKVLVPLALYEQLWQRAHPDENVELPPIDYAWAGAQYTIRLDADRALVEGEIRFEQNVDSEIRIPLGFVHCVLESAELNGQPAQLSVFAPQPQPDTANPETSQTRNPGLGTELIERKGKGDSVVYLVRSTGAGSKRLKFRLQCKVDRVGGWRLFQSQLPTPPATKCILSSERGDTEVWLANLDRPKLTLAPGESYETGMPASGFSFRWRDQISQEVRDASVVANSRALFDVQEDAQRFTWQVELSFRQGKRDSFTFQIPSDYLVKSVIGENIRSWEVTEQAEGTLNRLDVELLKTAENRASLVLLLYKRFALDLENPTELSVPEVLVPDAMLHQGSFTIRRSALMELRARGEMSGLSRIDIPNNDALIQAMADESPISLQNYQAYRFSQAGLNLPLEAETVRRDLRASFQSVLHIGKNQTRLQSRLVLESMRGEVHRLRIRIPNNWQLDQPEYSGAFDWTVMQDETGPLLEIYFKNALPERANVLLNGELTRPIASDANSTEAIVPEPIELPQLRLLDCEEQTGAFALQTEAAYDLAVSGLRNCESTLLSSVTDWLSPEQHASTKSVIQYRLEDADYAGTLSVTARAPVVSTVTLSNIRVTDWVIEETILLDVNVEQAGIQEYVFRLPKALAEARVQAPFLRRKTVKPVPDSESVEFQLELQDAIMDQLVILVHHDRPLNSATHPASIPEIQTGDTIARFVTLENAGRDELLAEDLVSAEAISGAIKYPRLQELVSSSAQSFRIREVDNSGLEPAVTFSTKTRESVLTTQARIGLAQTLLVVDEFGAFCGTQEYRVENRTEPYLEVAVPANARLWTVSVAGEPVKPARVPNQSGHVRIPLIKTVEGDLDYGVILKYGGRLGELQAFGQLKFPLLETINITPELSQVRLRLPERHHWYNFDGSLGRVLSEAELQAGWLSFRTKQIAELTELLGSDKRAYSKMRAKNNLKQLESAMAQQWEELGEDEESLELREQELANRDAVELAREKISEVERSYGQEVFGNSARLEGLYAGQRNQPGFDSSLAEVQNFNAPLDATRGAQPGAQRAAGLRASQFNERWLDQNALRALEPQLAQLGMGSNVDRQSQQEAPMQEPESDAFQTRERLQDNVEALNQFRQRRGRGGRMPALQEETKSLRSSFDEQASSYGAVLEQTLESSTATLGKAQTRGADFGLAAQIPFSGESGSEAEASFGDDPFADSGPGSLPAGYLASLEIRLPERGREYLFTTPGGTLELAARTVPTRYAGRLWRIGWALAFIAIFALLVFVLQSIARRGWGRLSVGIVCTALGIFSLLLGWLPVYGIAGILTGLSILASKPTSPGQASTP